MALGAVGTISVVSNVAPALMATLCRAMRNGDLQTARDLQPEVLAWFDLLFSHPNPVPTKVLTAALGFGAAAPRLPHVGLTAAETEQVLERAAALGLRR
jgi:4-hydroxy-tetrahydrodipicolinate synthase